MKRLLITAIFATIGASAASWSGTISDASCGAKHNDASDKSIACVKKCVEGGAVPVFVVGDKVYKIANPDEVKNHLGRRIRVTGTIEGDTITISSLSAPR